MRLLPTAIAAGLSGAFLAGTLALTTPASAQPAPPPEIPSQGEPALDTPFKDIPRPIIGALREPFRDLPQVENFELVAHGKVKNAGAPGNLGRGRNGGIAIQDNCVYVGSRLERLSGTGEDFGNEAQPPEIAILRTSNLNTIGHFQTPLGSNNREIRTIQDKHTLISLIVGDEEGATSNGLWIYDTTDCRNPVLAATVNFGMEVGHEFYLWRDWTRSDRFLVLVSMNDHEPSLRIWELIIPGANPSGITPNQTPVATFTLNPAVPTEEETNPDRYRTDNFLFNEKPDSQTNGLHTMSMTDDGTRVYMSNSQAGYFLLDSSKLARGESCTPNTETQDETTNQNPDLCLRKINPDPNARIDLTPPYTGIHHSFYPIPNRKYGIASGERNGTDTCPWTPAEIVDVYDEMNPVIYSYMMVPENLPENCFLGGPGDPRLMREFSTHQPLIFENLYFLSYYSAGLRAWDISNPRLPMEVGVFVPKPVNNLVEYFRDSRDVWMWSFPVLHNGFIYVSDDNNGVYKLRYTGPRANELPEAGTFGSNDNLGRPPISNLQPAP